jgi:hypothetical protein
MKTEALACGKWLTVIIWISGTVVEHRATIEQNRTGFVSIKSMLIIVNTENGFKYR